VPDGNYVHQPSVIGTHLRNFAFLNVHYLPGRQPTKNSSRSGNNMTPNHEDFSSRVAQVDFELRTFCFHGYFLNPFSERPRIRTNTVDLDRLRKLPPNSFGNAYVAFLDHYVSLPPPTSSSTKFQKYSPDERHLVHFVDDPDLAYVMQRYREVHDLVHTLLEQPTDMLGEVVVKWVEGIQTGLPMCLTGGFAGSLRLAPIQTRNYLNTHLDYALRVGFEGRSLMNVYFEEHWEQPLGEFRSSLNIPHPPVRHFGRKRPKASTGVMA
ncbi:ubiquinone biosynthesis protein COQ4 homolog mitochondrial, partial [Clonorchis sinensis]